MSAPDLIRGPREDLAVPSRPRDNRLAGPLRSVSVCGLAARIRAALRRRAELEAFVLGDLAIHYDERRVSVAGRPVELTASEFELLRVLSQGAGRVQDHETLLRRISGKQDDRDARNALRTLVKGVHQKLGESADAPSCILTERGVGYRMPRPGSIPAGGR